MWYVAAILLFTAAPPNMFNSYSTQFLPVPYTTKTDCENSLAWLKSQNLPPPSPTTRQVFTCVQL